MQGRRFWAAQVETAFMFKYLITTYKTLNVYSGTEKYNKEEVVKKMTNQSCNGKCSTQSNHIIYNK